MGTHHAEAFVDDAIQRTASGEELWFRCGDDDGIEEVPPRGLTGEVAIEGVPHHPVRVLPFRVRDQQDLLAGVVLVQQCERHLWVGDHEPFGIGDDLLLRRPSMCAESSELRTMSYNSA